MDCTFCLDCIKACPHENVGIIAVRPGHDLVEDRPRSSVGRYSTRLDLAALVLILTFGAFANAAGMVAPVLGGISEAASALNFSSDLGIVTLLSVFVLIILPADDGDGSSRLEQRNCRHCAEGKSMPIFVVVGPDRICDVAGAFCFSFVYGRSHANPGNSPNRA